MPGSQLKQLAGALRDAGLSRSNNNSRKKKNSGNKKSASSVSIDPTKRAAQLSKIHDSFNHFDLKHQRAKHDNTKKNIVAGKPSVSKQTSIEQRRKALLPELERRGKTGSVVDRRFGESNPHLNPEEKALERFKSERQGRPSRFNIEDTETLTHFGHSLFDNDEKEKVPSRLAGWGGGKKLALKEDNNLAAADNSDDEGEGEGEGEDMGGFTPKKSKAEIMSEVIAKSKAYRYERQKAREEDDEARQALDDDMKEVMGLLNAPVRTGPTKSSEPASISSPQEVQPKTTTEAIITSADVGDDDNTDPAELTVDRDLLAQLLGSNKDDDGKKKRSHDDVDNEDEGDEEYDRNVRSLFYERRARPSDRLKTHEELAFEAAEALRAAEKSRQKRMAGEEDDDEDKQSSRKSKKSKKGKNAAREGDDLEDDFVDDDDNFLGAGLESEDDGSDREDADSENEDVNEEGEENENDSEEDEENEELIPPDETDSSEDEEFGAIGKEPAAAEALETKSAENNKNNTKKLPPANSDEDGIAYSFECPEDHDSLLELLGDRSDEDVFKIMDRVRVLYHPRISQNNKFKLEKFATVMLDHWIYLTSKPNPPLTVINSLFTRLCNATKGYTRPMAAHFVSKLVLMQRNLTKGLSMGALESRAKTWPGFTELAFIKGIGKIWSTSDKSHPVAAPALLLACQYLDQCRLRRLSDLLSGLLVCSICLEYENYSKRIIPEVINFIATAILVSCPHNFSRSNLPGFFSTSDIFRSELDSLKVIPSEDESLEPSEDIGIASVLDAERDSKLKKLDCLKLSLDLLQRVAEMYAGIEAFVEIFEPFLNIVENILETKDGVSNKWGKIKLQQLQSSLARQIKLSKGDKKPLQLQSHRPVPIPSYVPKFDDGGGSSRFDPDSVRNEQSRLKAMVRKEKKGALRELRKDNRFLASEEFKRKQQDDEQYHQKMTKIMASLAEERAEEKTHERNKQREKAKDRKRSGRR